MTQEDLKDHMISKEGPLWSFNNEKVDVDENTILSTVIQPEDGSQDIFKQLTKWTLRANKVPTALPHWPNGWQDYTVSQLVKLLIPFLMFLFVSMTLNAQLVIDLGAVKTTSKANAVNIGISYFRSLDSIWKLKDIDFIGKHSILSINPEFNVRFGTQDAFSSIQAKVVGSFLSFKTTDFRGNIVPDYKKTINRYPIALGVESNSAFTIYNGIFEAGYVPYYQSETNSIGDVLRHTKFGLWLQAGYKFKGDSTSTPLVGGAKDESSEKYNSSIVRLKGSAGIDTKKFLTAQGFSMGLVGNADVWYDVIHSRFYHKIDAIARFYLSNGAWVDAVYSKGAGAPTFNENDQYGVGFKVQL